MQMATKCMNKCLPSLFIREIQIKTMTPHTHKMAIIKKKNKRKLTNVGENVEKLQPSPLQVEI